LPATRSPPNPAGADTADGLGAHIAARRQPRSLAQAIVFLAVPRTDGWQFRQAPLAAVQLLAAGAPRSLASRGRPVVFAAGLAVRGMLVAATFTASISYSLRANGPRRRRTGPHEAINASAFPTRPLVRGLPAAHLVPRAGYAAASRSVLAAVALDISIVRRPAAGTSAEQESAPEVRQLRD